MLTQTDRVSLTDFLGCKAKAVQQCADLGSGGKRDPAKAGAIQHIRQHDEQQLAAAAGAGQVAGFDERGAGNCLAGAL